MQARWVAIGATAVTAIVLTGCANSATESASSTVQHPVSPAATSSVSPAATEPHNNSDLMFANHMIPHHEQAVQMSDIVLAKPGVDPAVVDLATRIKAAQAPEIAQMRAWLLQWGAPTGTAGPGSMPHHDMGDMGSMPGMGDMGSMPGMGDMAPMAGMLSAAELAALQSADGAAAGKLYVSGMIEHHRGAITMASDEIDDGQSPAAVALARSIITAQQQEIDEMTALLPKL